MAEKVMSIHQALAELKLYDNKIWKGLNKSFVTYTKKGNDKIGSYTIQEYSDLLKGDLDSVRALIENKKIVKSAIVLSNANTKITIGDKEYTVAEAIERKSMIDMERKLLAELKSQYVNAMHNIETKNESLKNNLESYLKSVIGEKDKSDPEIVAKFEKQFYDNNEYYLVDPCKINDVINELEKEIDEFDSEVDYKLSESNTITKITVNLID